MIKFYDATNVTFSSSPQSAPSSGNPSISYKRRPFCRSLEIVSLFQKTSNRRSTIKLWPVHDGDVVVCSQLDERNEDWFHILRCISDSKILPQSMLHVF